jgi:hypothetical protein
MATKFLDDFHLENHHVLALAGLAWYFPFDLTRLGRARRGLARQGSAGRGVAGQGEARLGEARNYQ